jgi:leucine-zipper of insertion element IS481
MGDRSELPAGGDLPMPWKATCQMDERMQFIARVLAGEDEMTVLCREYGVSRKTGYKWLGRYISEGAAGLAERSHAPLQHGQAHGVAVVQAVLGLRQRWPHWGPKKHASGCHHRTAARYPAFVTFPESPGVAGVTRRAEGPEWVGDRTPSIGIAGTRRTVPSVRCWSLPPD